MSANITFSEGESRDCNEIKIEKIKNINSEKISSILKNQVESSLSGRT